MTKMIQLTTNSWLLRPLLGNAGLLFKNADGYLFMSNNSQMNFNSLPEIESKFGKLVLEERAEEEEVSNIRGYPVKHQGITIVSEDPPHYSTGGKISFVAGYWGLKFSNGWTQAYCPKVSTTLEYESVGPFKNKLEMLNHLSTLNTTESLKG